MLEKLKSSVVRVQSSGQEIEFYASEDGMSSGVSQSGLANLVGLTDERALFAEGKLGWRLSQASSTGIPDSLKVHAGNVFLPQAGWGGAKIIRGEVAAAIIHYYAYEAKNKSLVAQRSFQAFAAIGIDRWIKSMVGFQEPSQDGDLDLNSMVRQLIAKQRETESKIDGITKALKTYPLFEEIRVFSSGNEGQKLLKGANDRDEYTLQEFLELKGVELDLSTMHLWANRAAETYKSLKKDAPAKQFRYWGAEAGKEKKGKSRGKYTVYSKEDFGLLQSCLEDVMAAKAIEG